jgi:hypothetical protein
MKKLRIFANPFKQWKNAKVRKIFNPIWMYQKLLLDCAQIFD